MEKNFRKNYKKIYENNEKIKALNEKKVSGGTLY